MLTQPDSICNLVRFARQASELVQVLNEETFIDLNFECNYYKQVHFNEAIKLLYFCCFILVYVDKWIKMVNFYTLL